MPMQIRRTVNNGPPVGLMDGQLSVEQGLNPPKLWVGVPTAVNAAGRIQLNTGVVISATEPANAGAGMLWFNSLELQTYIRYDDGTNPLVWVPVSPVTLEQIEAMLAAKEIVFSDTAPTLPPPVAGDLWFDTVNNVLMTYDGANWVGAPPDIDLGFLSLSGGHITGNVSIGTTPTQTLATGSLGSLSADFVNVTSATANYFFNAYSVGGGATGFRYLTSDTAAAIGVSVISQGGQGELTISTAPVGTADQVIPFETRLVFYQNGNVQMPVNQLSVSGAASGVGDPLVLSTTGADCRILTTLQGVRTWSSGTLLTGSYGISDETAGNTWLSLDGSGTVTLYGNAGIIYAGAPNAVKFNYSGGDLYYLIDTLSPTAICTQTNARELGLSPGGGGPLGINLNVLDRVGNLYALFVDAASDARVKHGIADTRVNALDILRQMPLRQFTYNDSDFHVPIGMVADEIEELIPEMVGVARDGLRHLNAKMAVPYLIRAVQQLAERMAELEGARR